MSSHEASFQLPLPPEKTSNCCQAIVNDCISDLDMFSCAESFQFGFSWPVRERQSDYGDPGMSRITRRQYLVWSIKEYVRGKVTMLRNASADAARYRSLGLNIGHWSWSVNLGTLTIGLESRTLNHGTLNLGSMIIDFNCLQLASATSITT